ncbi:hypothetical protein QYE76_005630 [Lolium multiflorum]|uniref:Protein kinase domain-containing protein n=1 Tax=Lolium multiflorum TaxID=4521 RepID=A0AAD8RU56_LOLMU|nr:hypothetical protein QYE76_005630 [Lolium multiflorum]
MEPTEISGWERSKISNQDLNTLKTLGLMKKEGGLIFPGEESFPIPRIGYRGWRRRWLYIREENVDSQEYNISPFDGAAKISRRRSWDAEATDDEKTTTNALMKRIHELQNTRGKELSGVQITTHFLRIRVQARKNPLWMYVGEEDVDRVSEDLSVKDLERLVRCFSSLSKKQEVPTSCRVEPYSGNHALPENHQTLSSPPPLPEGGEVDERTVITDESIESSPPEPEVAGSRKSAASSDKDTETDASESVRSHPSVVSPKNKRKRSETKDSGASKNPLPKMRFINSAVDFCHSRGIYQCDLKPENFLLDGNRNLKISDFGLSALAECKRQDGLLHTTCGTPAYVAPELICKKGYDGAKADIWACGVILYVLLAGYLPFEDKNSMNMYRKVYKAKLKWPS